MDNDRIDSTAPANRPHEFMPGGLHGRTPAICAYGFPVVCGRGSGHHVHDVHDVPAEPSTEPNTPHVFIPGGVTVEGIGEYCKVCGFLEDAFDHAHIAPAELNTPHEYAPEYDVTGNGLCKICKRGALSIVHGVKDTAPEPTRIEPNTPHAYAPEFDPSGRCKVCGHMPDYVMHRDNAPGIITEVARALADSSPGNPPRFTGKQAEEMGAAFDEAYAKGVHGLTAPDPVNQPAHYTAHPSGVECIQITEHMSFNLGNAVKYIWRADLKGDAITDLEKARWYIEREIDRRRTRE